MEHVLEFTSRKLFRTNFCGGWGTKGIAFLYSIYCILILSYVKLLFYGFIDKISNSCGVTDPMYLWNLALAVVQFRFTHCYHFWADLITPFKLFACTSICLQRVSLMSIFPFLPQWGS